MYRKDPSSEDSKTPNIIREKEDELDSVVDMASDISNNEGLPPCAEAPTDYDTHSSWTYETFQAVDAIEIANKIQSNQNLNKSSSDSSQIDPALLQFHGMPRDVVENAAVRDMAAYQHVCGPTSSQPESDAVVSSSIFRSSYQQFGENLANIGEQRRIKNRQAAKESRRRKKEYVRYLEDSVYMLQRQNKSLMEELDCLRKQIADKQ